MTCVLQSVKHEVFEQFEQKARVPVVQLRDWGFRRFPHYESVSIFDGRFGGFLAGIRARRPLDGGW